MCRWFVRGGLIPQWFALLLAIFRDDQLKIEHTARDMFIFSFRHACLRLYTIWSLVISPFLTSTIAKNDVVDQLVYGIRQISPLIHMILFCNLVTEGSFGSKVFLITCFTHKCNERGMSHYETWNGTEPQEVSLGQLWINVKSAQEQPLDRSFRWNTIWFCKTDVRSSNC